MYFYCIEDLLQLVKRSCHKVLNFSRKQSRPSKHSSFQISSAMSLTSLNTVYLFNEINRFFPMNGKVTVNATLVLTDTAHTRSLVVKRDIQKKLIEVIQVK